MAIVATCDVCEKPIFHDESRQKDAFRTVHVRCSSGTPEPRPAHMSPMCQRCERLECRCIGGKHGKKQD
jgi:hypothetical protein